MHVAVGVLGHSLDARCSVLLRVALLGEGAEAAKVAFATLVSCLTAGVASVAQHHDIRNEFPEITVSFDADVDASTEDLQALVAQS